ncbi:MAG: BamA/TamA family outer membrane protein [Ekhidna sp.]
MRKYLNFGQISVFAGIFLSSCLGSKFLDKNEKLLVSQKVHGLSSNLEDEAVLLYQQTKNSRLFGLLPFSHLSYVYQRGENGFLFIPGYDKEKAIAKRDSLIQKFDRKIKKANNTKRKQKLREKKVRKVDRKRKKVRQGNQLMRWGEEPAVYNHIETEITSQSIRQLLNAEGYFTAKVEIDTSKYDSLSSFKKNGRKFRNGFGSILGDGKKFVDVNYYAEKGPRFYIDSIQYVIEDTALQTLIYEKIEESPLKKSFYKQEKLKEERNFIYDIALNNGYFDFSKQFILFQLDTIQLGRDTLIINTLVKNPPNKDRHKVSKLDSVIIYSNADNRQADRISEKYKDINFMFGKDKYSKKILEWRIPLKKGDKYSRDLTIETQRQLSYLDNFKFVNINYDTTGGQFIANIFTSPIEKFSTSSEFGLSASQGSSAEADQGTPGPFFNINLKNRNTFRALEIININAFARLRDIGSAGENQSDARYSSINYGGELSIDFPQFLFPLKSSYKKKIGSFNPRTRLSIGPEYENRDGEYIRTEVSTAFSYAWRVKDKTSYTLTPVRLSLINSENTESFEEFLEETREGGNSYANSFLPAFVNSTSFQFNKTIGSYNVGQEGGFIQFSTEFGGHLNGVFRPTLGEGLEYYKFLRGNIDLRKINRLTRKLNLAYRLNIGIANTFGSNNTLPYDRYFFGGGSSSVRGWKPRRLGPGAFSGDSIVARGDYRIIDYDREQPGEILIETSVELRRDLFGFIDGAVFIDAGNIWLLKGTLKVDEDGDDGQFRAKDFIKEMAVAAGVGLRFDLSFLVFRLDLGLKMFDPAQKSGQRFVGDRTFTNFGQNSEINIGIGYPF